MPKNRIHRAVIVNWKATVSARGRYDKRMRSIIIGCVLFIIGLELAIPGNRGYLSLLLLDTFRLVGINLTSQNFSYVVSSVLMVVGLPLAFRGVAQLAAELIKKQP